MCRGNGFVVRPSGRSSLRRERKIKDGLKPALRTHIHYHCFCLEFHLFNSRQKPLVRRSFAERYTPVRGSEGRDTRRRYSDEHGTNLAAAASFSRSCIGGAGTTEGGGQPLPLRVCI